MYVFSRLRIFDNHSSVRPFLTEFLICARNDVGYWACRENETVALCQWNLHSSARDSGGHIANNMFVRCSEFYEKIKERS